LGLEQTALVQENDVGKEVGFYRIDYHRWHRYHWWADEGYENETCHALGEDHGQ
jgi:hypothetical protein